MKLTEFEDGAIVKISDNNTMFGGNKIFKVVIGIVGNRILRQIINNYEENVVNVDLICCEDWELVEPTYTNTQAVQMLIDGKQMISKYKDSIKIYKIENNEIYSKQLIRHGFSLDNRPFYMCYEIPFRKGLIWTEFKEKN